MTQGLCDTVILPAMGDQILKKCRTSTASWYPETGHAPFLEDPLRFNRELAEFVAKAREHRGEKEHPATMLRTPDEKNQDEQPGKEASKIGRKPWSAYRSLPLCC